RGVSILTRGWSATACSRLTARAVAAAPAGAVPPVDVVAGAGAPGVPGPAAVGAGGAGGVTGLLPGNRYWNPIRIATERTIASRRFFWSIMGGASSQAPDRSRCRPRDDSGTVAAAPAMSP